MIQKINDIIINFLKDNYKVNKISEIITDEKFINFINEKFNYIFDIEIISKMETINQLSEYIYKSKIINKKDDKNKEKTKINKYSLNTIQERFIFLYELNPNIPNNNIFLIIDINGDIDENLFKNSILNLIEINDVFKTKFTVEGYKYFQHVSNNIDVDTKYIYQNDNIDINSTINKLINLPFNLLEDYPYYFYLFKVGEKKYKFIFIAHHILIDGYGIKILLDDLNYIYNLEKKGQILNFNNKKFNSIDYALYEKNNIINNDKLKNYWIKKLGLYNVGPIKLNYDINKNLQNSFEGDFVIFDLPLILTKEIKEFCKNNKVTYFVFFLSILQIYFYRATQDEFISLMTITSNRNYEKIQSVIGCFINNLLIVNKIDGELNFSDYINKNFKDILADLEHQNLPYDIIVENSKLQGKTPNVLYVMLDNDLSSYRLSDFNLNINDIENNYTNFDLSFYISNYGDNFSFKIQYKKCGFNKKTIESLFLDIIHLTKNVFGDEKIKNIDIIHEKNKQIIFNDFEKKSKKLNKQFLELYYEKLEQFKNKKIIFDGDNFLRYIDVENISNMLYSELVKLGCKKGDVIGLLIDRNHLFIPYVLAIWKVGACYLPIDKKLPKLRIENIIRKSNCNLLIIDDKKNDFYLKKSIFINYSKNISNNFIYKYNINNYSLNDNAYILFTSGSTGEPKGVIIPHNGLLNHMYETMKYLNINKNTILSQNAGLSFDVSVWQLLTGLIGGFKTIIYGDDIILNPNIFFEKCLLNKITHLEIVPSYFKEYFNSKKFKENNYVKYILITGESFSYTILEQLRIVFKNAKIINAYGPAEASDDITFYTFKEPFEYYKDTGIPIGKPIKNTYLTILDNNKKLLPLGYIGEIYVSGICLAKGYLNDSDKTKSSFFKNTVNNKQGRIMYKTGDLGKINNDGNFICLGRSDFQVKIRGQRIETGEIQNILFLLEEIKDAIVVDKNILNSKELVAFYSSNKVLENAKIIKFLEKFLPNYMIPRYYIHLNNLPLNKNGKVDIGYLKNEYKFDYINNKITYSEIDENNEIGKIWKKVLGVQEIYKESNFFYIGGHSLKIIEIINHLNNLYNIKINISDLFNNPLFDDFENIVVNYLKNKGLKNVTDNINIKKSDEKCFNLSKIQEIFWLFNSIDRNKTSYNIYGVYEINGLIDFDRFELSLHKILEKHVILNTIFKRNKDSIKHVINKIPKRIINFYKGNGVKSLINSEISYNFNLFSDNLYRFTLIKNNKYKYTFVFVFHHIIFDGFSSNIFLKELDYYYNNNTEKIEKQFKYSDFIDYELNYTNNISFDDIKKKIISFEYGKVTLPTCNNLIKEKNKGNNYSFNIEEGQYDFVKKICNKFGVSPFVFFLSVISIFIYKISSQKKFYIGLPFANRQNLSFEKMIGLFANVLPFGVNIDNNLDYKKFLFYIRDQSLFLYENQGFPIVEMYKNNGVGTDLYNIVYEFFYQNNENKIGDILLNQINVKNYSSKVDLSIILEENNNGLIVNFEYLETLFDLKTLKNFQTVFIDLLNQIVKNQNKNINDYEIKIESKLSNNNFKKLNGKANILDYINKYISYNTNFIIDDFGKNNAINLNKNIEKILFFLINGISIEKGDKVGVLFDRNYNLIEIITSIFKAGGIYVPLDKKDPVTRIESIVKTSKLKVIITDDILKYSYIKINIYDINHILNKKYNKYIINDIIISDDDIAYIIHTSGTTGTPKGVMITHGNLINLLLSIKKRFNFKNNSNILLHNTLSFDMSILELFLPFVVNGNLICINENNKLDISKFYDILINNNISFFQVTPSFLSLLVLDEKFLLLDKILIFVGGEELNINLYNKISLNEKIEIYNMYGPTEATVWATYSKINKGNNNLTFDNALDNYNIYVLDEENKKTFPNIQGEICIEGYGVAKGYFGNNSNNFINSHLNNDYNMYKTGDIGYLTSDGKIKYIGRKDNQIKRNGFRVELQEIKNTFNICYKNNDSEVIICKLGYENKIVLFYSGREINDFSKFKINLPIYMLPDYFFNLKEFRINKNGKRDMLFLNDLFINNISKTNNFNKSIYNDKNNLSKTILDILNSINNFHNNFQVNNNDLDIEFDLLGFKSIDIIKLLYYLKKDFNYMELSIEDIYSNFSINKLGYFLDNLQKKDKLNNKKVKIINHNNFTNLEMIDYFNNILITGGTGFLGIYLVKDFEKIIRGKIFILVRGQNINDAKERFKKLYMYYFGVLPNFSKIEIILGDITHYNLNLDNDYLKIFNDLDLIINSSANVKHFGIYKDFYNTNYKGVENILSLINKNKTKFIHISTIGVFGDTFPGDKELNVNEESVYVKQDLSNFYNKTKFLAEEYITKQNNLNYLIFRVGHITSDSVNGKFQINFKDNTLYNYFNTVLNENFSYEDNDFFDLSPVNEVSESIILLSRLKKGSSSIFHIYNNNKISMKDIYLILEKGGFFKNRSVNFNFESIENTKKVLSLYNNGGSKIIYNNNITMEYLSKLGFKWIDYKYRYIDKIFKFIKKNFNK